MGSTFFLKLLYFSVFSVITHCQMSPFSSLPCSINPFNHFSLANCTQTMHHLIVAYCLVASWSFHFAILTHGTFFLNLVFGFTFVTFNFLLLFHRFRPEDRTVINIRFYLLYPNFKSGFFILPPARCSSPCLVYMPWLVLYLLSVLIGFW